LGIDPASARSGAAHRQSALRDRLLSILVNPRQMVHTGPHYVPEPRKTRADPDAAIVI